MKGNIFDKIRRASIKYQGIRTNGKPIVNMSMIKAI